MNKKIIIAIIMVAIFIMSGFAFAESSSYGNSHNVSDVYVDKNTVTPSIVTGNSDSMAVQFDNWYKDIYSGQNPESMAHFSASQRDIIFSKFIHSDRVAQKLLANKSNKSMVKFNMIDHQQAEKAFGSITHGKTIIGYNKIGNLNYKNKNVAVYSSSSSMLLNIKPELPRGVTSDSGVWVMVSVNYFVYHAPLWLGGWSVTYGENDVINSLYAGSSAQKYYNTVNSATTDEAILDDIAIGAIGVGLAFAAPSIGISAIAGGIIAAALVGAGAVVSVLAAVWMGDLTSLYESTYANEPLGNKYIWVYDSVNYYYPWITVGGSLDSSIGMYGYLSNGNVVTFIPNVPFVIFGGIGGVGGVEYAASLSGYTHSISNKIGLNVWAYAGAS